MAAGDRADRTESVAVGHGAVDGSSIGVAIGQSAGGPAAVYLHLCPQPGRLPVSIEFDAEQAAAFAATLPVLGGPAWLAEALHKATNLITDQSAAERSTRPGGPATPANG